MKHDEFYVGYLEKAPPAQAAFLRRRILGVFLLLALLAVALVLSQQTFGTGVFEYGRVQSYEAVVRLHPVPVAMAQPSEGDSLQSRYYLLVNQGKFGAAELFAGMEGLPLSFDATRIHREGQQMLEVVPGSIRKGRGLIHAPLEELHSLGPHRFQGEIVDSKCYLGVMNPGNLKTHKSCAIRCLSGGIPPVLIVRDRQDQVLYMVLVGPDGEALNDFVLDKVAVPVEASGDLRRGGSLLYLVCEPADIRAL